MWMDVLDVGTWFWRGGGSNGTSDRKVDMHRTRTSIYAAYDFVLELLKKLWLFDMQVSQDMIVER
jgi:hypothetical protein